MTPPAAFCAPRRVVAPKRLPGVGFAAVRREIVHSESRAMVATKFNVGMTCEGCAGAVKRILGKVDGVTSIETNVAEKTVVVEADPSVTPESMLEKLKKWSAASGKSVELA